MTDRDIIFIIIGANIGVVIGWFLKGHFKDIFELMLLMDGD